MEWFAVQRRTHDVSIPLKFPGKNRSEIFIITLGLAVGRLMFFTEMAAA
jgi:hypothetical protein